MLVDMVQDNYKNVKLCKAWLSIICMLAFAGLTKIAKHCPSDLILDADKVI